MHLYEIDEAIINCFDPETGELLDEAALERLNIQREQKIENILLYLKDTKAEAEAIANEIKKLQKRKQAAENRAERLKTYAKYALNGEKFKTARVNVYYQNREGVELDEGVTEETFIEWAKVNRDELLRYKEPEINRVALSDALKAGEEIHGAHLETKSQIIIK